MDGMNKEKWQSMTLQEKYNHFMYYYKTYVIIGLVVLIVGGVLLYHVITHVEPDLSILMINNTYQEIEDQSMFDEFSDRYGYDNSEGKMAVLNNFYIKTEEEGADGELLNSSYQNLSALQTWMYAGQDDVIIGNGVFVKNSLVDGEAFLDLREVFTPEQMEMYAEYIVYGKPVDMDEEFEDVVAERTEPYPCALLLKDNSWLMENGSYQLECYVGIAVNAGSKEAAADFLEYLLSKQPQ